MRFSTNATSRLSSIPIVNLRPNESDELEALGGETPSVSPLDLGNGFYPLRHGSFEGYPSFNSSNIVVDSQDIFFDALEEAENAYLTNEEATTYLKNVLNLGSNPTNKNSVTATVGDARHSAYPVNHGQP
jgi:hypothetical protein